MSKLQPVRGTRDIFGEDIRRFSHVTDAFRRIAGLYGFDEIITPIFEFTDVFRRTLGDSSDVVTKEMYSFEDRSGEMLTLRPEYTAGIARAYISNGLAQQGVVKLFGYGPMFRYERPQKGRYRQFHQLDAEIIGAAEPMADIELLALAWQLLNDLGIAKDIKLHLNSLGDPESRAAYRQALVGYFSVYERELSEDSRVRLHKNPMRILDSKDPGDRALLIEAPRISDYLTPSAKDFFARVCDGVSVLGIPFVHDEKLVRGLDYYTHTAFEFITDTLGAQGTVLAGGRYDGLMAMMGASATPGVGWAAGIERLSMLIADPDKPRPDIVMIPLGERAERSALTVVQSLRAAGYNTSMDYKGNMKKRLNRAAKAATCFAVLLGDDELEKNVATIRNLDSGVQEEVALDQVLAYFSTVLSSS